MVYQDIKFKDDTAYKSRVVFGQPQTPKLLIFVQNHSGGLIRSSKQAGQMVLIFAGLILVISFFLFLRNSAMVRSDLISAPVPAGGYQGLPETGKSYPTLIPEK
ncbi:MAG: hypothetical protein HY617_00460 [Candidatus Sungbacteria bacterium]|nr:hypothetical protein [Candidatus Sungbacteria bacterium]